MSKKDKTEILNMLDRVFNGKNGKQLDEFLRDLCNYDNELFSDDPYRTAFLLGRRSVYLNIKRLLKEAKDAR